MKKIKKILICFVAVFALMFGLPVFADDNNACTLDPNNPACVTEGGDIFETFDSIMNVVLGIVGIIATIVIIVSGVMMTTSQGDAGKVKKARSAILYAAIGMVLALVAWGIVGFVVHSL